MCAYIVKRKTPEWNGVLISSCFFLTIGLSLAHEHINHIHQDDRRLLVWAETFSLIHRCCINHEFLSARSGARFSGHRCSGLRGYTWHKYIVITRTQEPKTKNRVIWLIKSTSPSEQLWFSHRQLTLLITNIKVISLVNLQVAVRKMTTDINTWGHFYKHGLTLIPAWISNYDHYSAWNIITYSFLNFNAATVEV